MAEFRVAPGLEKWFLVSILVASLPHVTHVPLWAFAGAMLLTAWRFYRRFNHIQLPSKGLRYLLAGVILLAVFFTYRAFLGRDPGMTALIMLSALKLLETEKKRDYQFVLYIGYFLVLGNFLYSQTIPALGFMVISVLVISGNMILLHQSPSPKVLVLPLLKRSFFIFLQSLPFAVFLFFVFPRTSGPLWNMPDEGGSRGQTGFSDRVNPGSVATLARSKKTTFRVYFPQNQRPAQQDLYFRGAVLWNSGGMDWNRGGIRYRRYGAVESNRVAVEHEILLEPHGERWLFALDRPSRMPRFAIWLPGNVYESRVRVKKHLRYSAYSQLKIDSGKDDRLSRTMRRISLQVPRKLGNRVADLVASWRQNVNNPQDIINRASEFFRNQSFHYSLEPGTLEGPYPPLEDFLFRLRSGFCEHYAAAFSTLMRMCGIPSRLVIGYQGGTYNPVGQFLQVRQADAHAWSECWLEGRGWVRIDPTAFISPERITYGMDLSQRMSDLNVQEGESQDEVLRRAMRGGFWKRLFRTLEFHWDNINAKWNLYIMSYDRFQQRDVLRRLGLPERKWLLQIVTVAAVLVFISMMMALVLRYRDRPSDPVEKYFTIYCRRLAAAGINAELWEGPLDLSRRIKENRPDKSLEVDRVLRLYIQLKFGRAADRNRLLKNFRHAVRRCRFK